MKSLVNSLLNIERGILADYHAAYPEYRGVVRDFERLTLLAQTRGLGLFTLDLPSLDSLLVAGLENGRLVLDGPLSKRSSCRTRVPKLFKGLWLRVFDHNGCLKEDPDTNAILFLRQLCCLGKKLELGCSESRQNLTITEYYNVEKGIRRPSLRWSDDVLDPDDLAADLHFGDLLRSHSWFGELVDGDNVPISEQSDQDRGLLEQLQRNADAVAKLFGEFSPVEFSELIHDEQRGVGFRHGPGAVSERSGLFHKYRFVNWPEKLHSLFPFSECGTTASSGEVRPRNHEVPSKLLAVPKTAKAPRLIACEPTEHQWCQQLIKRFIEERLKGMFGDYFVSFNSQERSRIMANRASLDKRLATVDLSSASDRLSCYVVERMFRCNLPLLTALHAARTRTLSSVRLNGDSELIRLKKFASQGTATTFPVQTLVFFVCALTASGAIIRDPTDLLATRKGFKGKLVRRFGDQVRVFGDDIILPVHGYAKLSRLLHLLGLKVNMDKSFHKGHFREACGMDAFKGYDVTPVRPRSLSFDGPTLRSSFLDLSNNLFTKGFWRAAEATESIAGGAAFMRLLPVVGRRSGVIGRTSFCGTNYFHLKFRWNRKLCRPEARMWTFWSTSRRKPTNDWPGLLQYFAEAPAPDTNWVHGYQARPKTSDGLRWEAPM